MKPLSGNRPPTIHNETCNENTLVAYTPEANQKLIDFAFAQYMSPGLTRTAIKQLVLNYPSSLKVAEPSETAKRR